MTQTTISHGARRVNCLRGLFLLATMFHSIRKVKMSYLCEISWYFHSHFPRARPCLSPVQMRVLVSCVWLRLLVWGQKHLRTLRYRWNFFFIRSGRVINKGHMQPPNPNRGEELYPCGLLNFPFSLVQLLSYDGLKNIRVIVGPAKKKESHCWACDQAHN